jgi:hypothetical protein
VEKINLYGNTFFNEPPATIFAGIKQRQKYKKESKQLLQDTYSGHHPGRIKKSKKAKK